MHFEDFLTALEHKFSNHGSFALLPGQSINNKVEECGVPPQPGVYVIYGCTDKEEKVIYVGMSGSMSQKGSFGRQGLKKRLTMKQEGMYRKEFFKKIIKEDDCSHLRFEWFVTFDPPHNKLLPHKVEGELLQAYYDDFGCLPKYNRKY